MRDTGNIGHINAVAEPPRRRAVDRRVARGLDVAVREVRQELADDAQDDDRSADDGLTQAQVRFLASMRQRPSVGVAMRIAGTRFANLKRWRESARFRELEEEALEIGKGVLFEAAWNSAVIGWSEPVFNGGRCVGKRRRFSERIMELLLKSLIPEVFARESARGQPARERVIPGTPEQIAEVVRRLSPTARWVERPLPNAGTAIHVADQ